MMRTVPVGIPGPPAVAVALAPLAAIIALVALVGIDRDGIGPLSATALLLGVMAPLAGIYPGLSAFIAPRSRAETLVVGVTVAAPALAVTIPLLMEPITARCAGCQPDLWHEFIVRASFPVLFLLATFMAIEVAAAAMRRPGRRWVVAGVVLGAVTFGVGGLLSVMAWNLFL